MKAFCKTLLVTTLLAIAAITVPATANAQTMYRLYNANPASGEHFYTSNTGERDHLISLGWTYEGAGWDAPTSGADVYRLYNANGGEHHYTLNKGERDMLIAEGWTYEGVGWKSSNNTGTPLYRQYNPNAFANNHNYTTNTGERDKLIHLGWNDEKVSWYGTKDSAKVVAEAAKTKDKVIAEAKKTTEATATTTQGTTKVDPWWRRSQALSVQTDEYGARVYTFKDTNQPGCVVKVEELPNGKRAMIHTRVSSDTVKTYVKEEAWDEELYHWKDVVYCPYTNQYFDSYEDYCHWWDNGGWKVSLSYNNESIKVHDGWKHHDAVMGEYIVEGYIECTGVDL